MPSNKVLEDEEWETELEVPFAGFMAQQKHGEVDAAAAEGCGGEKQYPFSTVKDANVLVFPSLESANISAKLIARLGNARSIGPILLGMGAPIHVLQPGHEVNDIVQMAAVAVMDAASRK